MPGHPLHRPVQAAPEPVGQVRLVLGQVDAGDAAALETGLSRKPADAGCERGRIGRTGGAGRGNGGRGRVHDAAKYRIRGHAGP